LSWVRPTSVCSTGPYSISHVPRSASRTSMAWIARSIGDSP
jgi:hypothetical protein